MVKLGYWPLVKRCTVVSSAADVRRYLKVKLGEALPNVRVRLWVIKGGKFESDKPRYFRLAVDESGGSPEVQRQSEVGSDVKRMDDSDAESEDVDDPGLRGKDDLESSGRPSSHHSWMRRKWPTTECAAL